MSTEAEGAMARKYPSPVYNVVSDSDTFEIVVDGKVIANDRETRAHPEVPLTVQQRDAVLARLDFCRTGDWQDEEDGGATAPVVEAVPQELLAEDEASCE